MEKALKLGILGGTFDPIHMGHLIIAHEAQVTLGLSKMLFIPTGQPWLKAERPISTAQHRLAMVRLAVGDNPDFEVSTLELARPGPSYTVDTLVELRRRYGQEGAFYFILGQDSLGEFHLWKEPARILGLCTLVTMPRPESPKLEEKSLEKIKRGASKQVVWLNTPLVGISGTELRRRVGEGRSIRYWVPRAVEEYILKKGLYR